MEEPTESVIIPEEKFELNDILNSIEIEINDDKILNILNKYKNVYQKLTPLGILFPASITNDTKSIFVTCRELNDAKKLLINDKICSLIGIIELQKTNNWENINEKSLWVKATFNEQGEINNSKHSCFSLITS